MESYICTKASCYTTLSREIKIWICLTKPDIEGTSDLVYIQVTQ